jgi:hypothetical protein
VDRVLQGCDDIAHPVCDLGCAPLGQSRGADRKVLAAERADRRNQREDETRRGELRAIGDWLLTYRTSSKFGITSTAAFSVSNHRLP